MSNLQTLAREVVSAMEDDPWSAHETLFKRRHSEESAPAHRDLVHNIYRPIARLVIEGFRGFGKTTMLEETAIIRSLLQQWHNLVIVGSSYARSCDRLAAIKNELLINPYLQELGPHKDSGGTWQESKIVLTNGVCIQALGRDQSMLGMKHLDWRPDAALIDDVEDPDEVRTDAERAQTWGWFLKTFLPSLDHPLRSWVRVLGTRRGSGSLPERLEKDGWTTTKYPVEFIDGSGARRATWPGKFPLPVIDALKETYKGDMHTWAQEYMCQAVSETDRIFTRQMLRVEPRPRTHQAVYAMYDPARTIGQRSAATGKAVWSWERNRLIFWRAEAHQWLPDEIIEDVFKTQREFDCTWLGVEEDGLNEWLKQPIRSEMLKRRMMLPLLPVKAPRRKSMFIGQLQPFMKAGEVTFAGSQEQFSDAFDQFLSFPQGKIDAPNACAYALLLRPGSPVYEAFSDANVVDGLEPLANLPLYLAGNADGSVVAAALLQRGEGEIRILADWVREGTPADLVSDIHAEAMLGHDTSYWAERDELDPEQPLKVPERVQYLTQRPIKWIVPPIHGETYRNVGLMQAIRAIPQAVSTGGDPARGRVSLGELLANSRAGRPRVLLDATAHWTIRALAGGYARELGHRAIANPQPDAGIYRLLMEGIESFVAVGMASEEREDNQQPIAYDRHGRPYRSALRA